MSVTLDPEKFAVLMADLRADADRLEEKLAGFGPDTPAHWAPNIRWAAYLSLLRVARECVDSHLSPRSKGKAREKAEISLNKQIRAQPEWETYLHRLVALGVLRFDPDAC